MSLQGRTAIVTGGSRGLGFALVTRLAQEGANVVAADIVDCAQKLDELPSELGERILFKQTDVRDERQVQGLTADITGQFGQIDILVNNAAIFTSLERKHLDELTTHDWETVFAVNVFGVFHCLKAVSSYMKTQGHGKIINVASDAVFKGLPMFLHYVASKGAVFAMTRAAARELGQYNITVNAVAPGYMRHPDFKGWDAGRDEKVSELRSLARTQTPDDVVGSVVFFASSESDFITGQTLVVNGGEVFH